MAQRIRRRLELDELRRNETRWNAVKRAFRLWILVRRFSWLGACCFLISIAECFSRQLQSLYCIVSTCFGSKNCWASNQPTQITSQQNRYIRSLEISSLIIIQCSSWPSKLTRNHIKPAKEVSLGHSFAANPKSSRNHTRAIRTSKLNTFGIGIVLQLSTFGGCLLASQSWQSFALAPSRMH